MQERDGAARYGDSTSEYRESQGKRHWLLALHVLSSRNPPVFRLTQRESVFASLLVLCLD
jgi:hypothetical protein